MLKTYYHALEGHRRFAAWTVVLLICSGLSEAFGIAALLPLLSSQLNSKAGGRSSWFGLSGDELTLVALGLLVGLGLVSALLRFVGETRSYVLQVEVERSVRSRTVKALLGMRWNDYMSIVVGEGIKSVLIEAERVGTGAMSLVMGIGSTAIVAAFLAVALVVNPVMTAAFMVFGVFGVLLYRRVGHRAQQASLELSNHSGEMTESATDLLTNAKYYRSTGLQDRVLARLDTQFADWARFLGRVRRYAPATRLAFDSVGLLFIGVVLAGTLVVLDNSIAGALVFLALFYRLTPRLQAAQSSLLEARIIVSWIHTWTAQYEAALAVADTPSGTARLVKPPTIEFTELSLTYPGRSVPSLNSVSCAISPGECLAVVGESGSGKTTMLDLVTGLLRPSSGAIRLDGADLGEVDLQAWRERIGLVMQDAPVFQGTVLENIAWTETEPDEGRAWQVAEMANLGEVIRALPDGLQTEVGQRGGRFSGGQRQRLALARALYRDPWLLILDEATSALDSESEQVIQEALASLRGSCSMLLVAHRLKTVEIADRILVLSRGRVVEEGTWSALSSHDGLFRRMLTSQRAGAAVAS